MCMKIIYVTSGDLVMSLNASEKKMCDRLVGCLASVTFVNMTGEISLIKSFKTSLFFLSVLS